MTNRATIASSVAKGHPNNRAEKKSSVWSKAARFLTQFAIGYEFSGKEASWTIVTVSVITFCVSSLALFVDISNRQDVTNLHLILGLLTLTIGSVPISYSMNQRLEINAWILCYATLVGLCSVAYANGGITNPLLILSLLPLFWAWMLMDSKSSIIFACVVFLALLLIALNSINQPPSYFATDLLGLNETSLFAICFALYLVISTVTAAINVSSILKHKTILANEHNKAVQANAEQTAFIASVAHEVRTPMTGLLGMLELLNKEDLPDAQKEMVQTARFSARNIFTLINDLLDLSKLDVGELRLLPEPADIVSEFTRTVSEFAGPASEKGLELQIQKPETSPWLVIDSTRFRQCLSNYLSNAIKFTDEGHVTARLSIEEQDSGFALLTMSVEDSGSGIPKSLLAKVFARFVQVEGTQKSQHEGTGLGLAIVSDLAKLQGGKAWVESEEGSGSTFYFRAMYRTTNALDNVTQLLADENGTDPVILVADDSTGNQRVLTRVLDKLGYKTISAKDGQEAVDIFRDNSVDLILMDMNMPIKDGPTALADIRSMTGKDNMTPVIGLSADNSPADMQRWIEADVDGFIQKPVDFVELDLAIKRALGAHRSYMSQKIAVAEKN